MKKERPREVDDTFLQNHDLIFQEVDCLDCANCCKTISPIFTQRDIERISKYKNQNVGDFISNYLFMDEEGDFVLKSSPCVFLDTNNKCSIYEVRPKACREYPHTNDKKMSRHVSITKENVRVCPAAYLIVDQIAKQLINN